MKSTTVGIMRNWIMQLVIIVFSSSLFAAEPRPGQVDAKAVVAASAADRSRAGASLLKKWEPFILESGVASLDEWRSEMKALFERAEFDHIKLAEQRNVYSAMLKTLKGNPTTDEEALTSVANRSEQLGLDASQMKAFGDADKDLIYVPVSDCRIIDTRVAGGVIAANTTRSFDVTAVTNYSFQGGDASNCGGVGAAGSFAAAALRFTVVTPIAAGYITAYPHLGSMPLASTLNYTPGQIISSTTIVRLDQGASADELSVYSFAQTHLVVDIIGYFHNPAAPTLECVNSGETIESVNAGSTRNTTAPVCPAGYTETATNCESSTWQMPFVYFSGGTCSAQNNSSGTAQLRASRTCCRPKYN